MIELILLERVEKLGQMGQVVKVKPGYARNYLLPQKKAMRATKENLAYFETQRAQLEASNLQRRTEATEIGAKLEGLTVVLERPIKSLGMHQLRVVLHPEVSVGVTANVAQSAEEAAMQARGIDPLRLAEEDEEFDGNQTAPDAAPSATSQQ